MSKKRILSAILAAALAASALASCNNNNGGSSSNSSTPASDGSSSTASAPASSGGDDANAGGTTKNEFGIPIVDAVDGDTNLQTFPISESKITLSLWYPMAGSMGELSDFNDAEFFKWYEEKTNIHIDFILPPSGSEADAFQLLFASDDMPDMLYSQPAGQKYRGGEDKAIEDGYFVNMVDYLDIAPNYCGWLNNHDDFRRGAFSDTGKMYGMWGGWDTMGERALADQGLAIRKDFLDAVKKEVPTTYDEWYDVLVAFRDELHIEAPFYTSKWGIDRTGEFMAGFDTAPYFYQRDGKVCYGPMDDQYKEYLTMLHQWWEEGLLDKDFATRTSTGITADNDMMLNDKVGALVDYGTRLANVYVTRGATNPDFFLVGVTQPKKSGSDAVTPSYRDYASGNDMMQTYCMTFNADGEHIEEAIRWNDGFYAQDILQNANFGLEEQEGTVWYAAEDGHRVGIYDFRYKNPDGISSATVLVQFWTKNPPIRVESAQIEQSQEVQQEGYQLWSTYEPSRWISNRITPTAEEGTEFSSTYTDIETYVQECNVKFIMGQMSLDDYDSYRETLKGMGIERCIELRQAALDRYYAR